MYKEVSNMNTLTTDDFHQIVINSLPLIDVRSPKEYAKGAFLNSVNLPIMTDEERHLIGICYKEKGHDEAVKLGHELVYGDTKNERIKSWVSHIDHSPSSLLYCYKGGLRSQITQQWITDTISKDILRLDGGYKAFRNYLLNALEPSEQTSIPIVLSGNTGSGKTLLLNELKNSIDLEGLANHRGSAFGKQITPQPSQINFENNLAYALIKHKYHKYSYLIVEDEGRNVGSCFIPNALVEFFNNGDLVVVEENFEKRVYITLDEYVIKSQEQYIKAYGDEHGLSEWFDYLESSIHKVKKRLGLERYQHILDSFSSAYKHQQSTGKYELHKEWISILLKEYYDPMYEYQIQKKFHRIQFTGNYQEVKEFLESKENLA